MRIISDFRDYYDAVMKTGMDREVVYAREKKQVEIRNDYGIDFSTRSASSRYTIDLILLGYCGGFFQIYKVKDGQEGWQQTFHSYEDFKTFMLNNNISGKLDFGPSRWFSGKYYSFSEFDPSKMQELFHKFQTPLFTVSYENSWRSKNKVFINLGPSLNDLEFYVIKDPYTAYQDIFQYVAGVLNRPDSKMVKLSDKDKIHKHGFNKWSFRKPPGGKK